MGTRRRRWIAGWTGPGPRPRFLAVDRRRLAWGEGSRWDSGAAARPAPPRPAASAPPRGLRPFGERGVVSGEAGGSGSLRMRTGPALWGSLSSGWLQSSRREIGGGFRGSTPLGSIRPLFYLLPSLPPSLCAPWNTFGSPPPHPQG